MMIHLSLHGSAHQQLPLLYYYFPILNSVPLDSSSSLLFLILGSSPLDSNSLYLRVLILLLLYSLKFFG